MLLRAVKVPSGALLRLSGIRVTMLLVNAFSEDCWRLLPKQRRPTLKGTTVKRTIVAALLAFLGGGVMLVVVVAAWLMHSALSGRAPEMIEEVGPVYCVAVSRDGQQIVCGYQDSRARVWNINSGELLTRFGDQRPAVVCAAFSPDGKQIAFAHADESVRIWDLRLGRETRTFRGHTATIKTVAYMPNGKQVLSAGSDRTIRLWDIPSGSEVRCFRGHGADVNSVVPFNEGRKLISAGGDYWKGRVNDPSIRIWDVTTGKQLKNFVGELGPMDDVAISASNQFAVTCSWDTGIQVWSVNTGTEIRRFGDKDTSHIALSPDGRQVISGGEKGEVKLWSTDTGKLLLQLPGHSAPVNGVAFCPDGAHVVTCSGQWSGDGTTNCWGDPIAKAFDCTVRLWDISGGKEIRRFNGPAGP